MNDFRSCYNCYRMFVTAIQPVIVDPCDPNPCGPNSEPPREVNGQCRCRCLPEMIGSPPNCRPECVVNSDCSSDMACIRRKCVDPCPGLCGINAYCSVRNHIPICICNQGYIGDPFSRCRRPPSKLSIVFIAEDGFPLSETLLQILQLLSNKKLRACRQSFVPANPSCQHGL